MADSGFKVLTADHTGFCVTSLEKALPFWTDCLGFKLLRRGEIGSGHFLAEVANIPHHGLRFALLAGYGHQVELCEYFDAEREAVPPGIEAVGAVHLCLLVDDLDATLKGVASYGYTPAGIPQVLTAGPRAGTTVVFVSDSDGIHLELMQPPAQASAP